MKNIMKVSAKTRLFWFLKDSYELNLNNPSIVDMYVQQVLTRGKADDVRKLFKKLEPEVFKKSFERIKKYLPKETRMFWEDGLGDTG
jgi:NurA-like 5'-3' nuclease